jgi:hypothetical protein
MAVFQDIQSTPPKAGGPRKDLEEDSTFTLTEAGELLLDPVFKHQLRKPDKGLFDEKTLKRMKAGRQAELDPLTWMRGPLGLLERGLTAC